MDVTSWLSTDGYGTVLPFVGIESTDIPFPGETRLLIVTIATGTIHLLSMFLEQQPVALS